MKMLDIFSGIGGFSLAASWTDQIETVAFCEIEPYCQKVLHKHWPDVPIFPNIKKLRGESIGSVDIVCGGPPCQPASCAGERRGQDDDRWLWEEVLRIIQEIKPTWYIFENVNGLLALENGLAFNKLLSQLEDKGYEVQAYIIPACAVNAPHRRDRVWIVGFLSDTGSLRHARLERLQQNNRTNGAGRASASRPTPQLFNDIAWKERAEQSGFLGSNDGISRRLHRSRRIKALGNAIVPQAAYQIFKAIVEIEGGTNHV